MKFIELFAGIGGFRIGLQRAGHECIWANEWLERPRGIYEYHYKSRPDGRDIRIIQPDEIPRHELLTAGFPCATFSVAGKRTGFSTEDTRGTLFFEVCRVLRTKRTPYFLLENVKGLLNHDNGRTFGIILSSLDELGYDVQWEVLNSKNFGVPQHRERVFIVGNLRGISRPKVFPIGFTSSENGYEERKEHQERQGIQGEPYNIAGGVHPTIDANYWKGGRTYIEDTRVMQWRRNHFRQHKSDGIVPTLTANMGMGGHNVPLIQEGYIERNNQGQRVYSPEGICPTLRGEGGGIAGKGSLISVQPCLTPDRQEKRQNGRRLKEHNEPAHTLTAQDRHGVMINNTRIRKFTPLEVERIAGLPENYTKFYMDDNGKERENSNADRYERCGRTVTPNVIYEIGRRLGYEWY